MEIVVGSHDFLVKDVGDIEEASGNASLIQYDHCRDSCLFLFEDPNTSDMRGNGWEVSPRAGEHMNSVVEHVGVRATSDNRNKQKAKGNLRYIYVMNEYVHT
jgi:hypothetical protein